MGKYGGIYEVPENEQAYIDGSSARENSEPKKVPPNYSSEPKISTLWLAGWHDKDMEFEIEQH